MRLRCHISAALLTLLAFLPARAQDLREQILGNPGLRDRIQSRATMYGAGPTNVFDTYLSPQEYSGWGLRISRENLRKSRYRAQGLYHQSYFHASLSYSGNRADNNHMISSLASWNYGYLFQFPLTDRLRLLAGALAEVSAGFTYSMRGGNNPASFRGGVALQASGMAVYDLRMGSRTIPLRYQLFLPMVGLTFSPRYGESFYEIYVRESFKGNVKVTTPFSRPSAIQTFSADIPVKKIRLRISYVLDIQQTSLNGLRTHNYSHAFMVGVIKDFIRL